jgi:hypothetical protein
MARPVVLFAHRLPPQEAYELLVDSLPPRVERPDDDAGAVARMDKVLAIAMDPRPERRCTVTELDAMLGALIAGHDPEVPARLLGDDDTMDLELSVPSSGQVMAPREGKDPEGLKQLAVDAAPLTTSSASHDTTVKAPPLRRGPHSTRPEPPEAEASMDGSAAAEAPGSESPPRARTWVAAAVALLVLLGIVVVGGSAVVLWVMPDLRDRLMGSDKPLPVELTGRETDPSMQADWHAIQKSVATVGPPIARRCAMAAKVRVPLELVIEPDGSLRSVDLMDDSPDKGQTCVAEGMERAHLSRTWTRPVRVRVDVAG